MRHTPPAEAIGQPVTEDEINQMRAWLADAATFIGEHPCQYLDSDLVADHDVLHLIEHSYFGTKSGSRGVTAFLEDGTQTDAAHRPVQEPDHAADLAMQIRPGQAVLFDLDDLTATSPDPRADRDEDVDADVDADGAEW